jgi:hypothetical protein
MIIPLKHCTHEHKQLGKMVTSKKIINVPLLVNKKMHFIFTSVHALKEKPIAFATLLLLLSN